METFKEIAQFIRTLYNQPTGPIPLHVPVFMGNEKKYLEECVDSTFVSSVGKFVDQFEIEIAKYTGSNYAVACVNGTSALHLALKLVGVKPEDEVITQPLTFIATANAITYCGAQPVFLDVDKDTMGLSPVNLETWLEQNIILKKSKTLKTKSGTRNFESRKFNLEPFNKSTGKRVTACVPMHTFGHPCRIDQIVEICSRFNIPVVEDAAESLGSFYKNRHTGTFGAIGVLSFNGNKILTTGGGGMLLFEDEELAKRAKHLSTQAKVHHPWEFAHDEIGYNYRMPNINAALGLAQLEQLLAFLKSKRQTALAYKDFFSSIRPLTPPSTHPFKLEFITEPPNAQSNYWLNCILLNSKDERDAFLKYTNDMGVMTRPTWKLINELPVFNDCQTDDVKNANIFHDRLINLPSSVMIEK